MVVHGLSSIFNATSKRSMLDIYPGAHFPEAFW